MAESKVIRISGEVARYIESQGQFGETWDEVLRRLLRVEKGSQDA